jgi:hypothetical protein
MMSPDFKMTRDGNDHSFTLYSNGYRLVAKESDEELPSGYPYCYKFGIVSFDGNGNYARMGIGKVKRNDANSFTDGIEKQMVCLQEERRNAEAGIEELKRKLHAIDDFLEVLPQIFLNDGTKKD